MIHHPLEILSPAGDRERLESALSVVSGAGEVRGAFIVPSGFSGPEPARRPDIFGFFRFEKRRKIFQARHVSRPRERRRLPRSETCQEEACGRGLIGLNVRD